MYMSLFHFLLINLRVGSRLVLFNICKMNCVNSVNDSVIAP